MTNDSAAPRTLTRSRPFRSLLALLAFMLAAALLVACDPASEPAPISSYRLVDDRTIDVLVTARTSAVTWVESIEETPAAVVVTVLTKVTILEGLGPADAIWMRVKLDAPLENRAVLDAVGNHAVRVVR